MNGRVRAFRNVGTVRGDMENVFLGSINFYFYLHHDLAIGSRVSCASEDGELLLLFDGELRAVRAVGVDRYGAQYKVTIFPAEIRCG